MTDTIRRKVKAQLIEQGIDQQALAESIGLSYSYVNKLLTGKRDGSADTWVALLDVVGLELVVRPKEAQ